MPLSFKVDIQKKLKECGYNTTRIRREQILSETVLTKIRNNDTSLNLDIIGRLCYILRCQPADLLEYTPDFKDSEDFKNRNWKRKKESLSLNKKAPLLQGSLSIYFSK